MPLLKPPVIVCAGFRGTDGPARRAAVRRFVGTVLSLILVLLVTVDARASEPTSAEVEFFENRIRPVLVDRCYECHDGRKGAVKGGLAMETRDGLRRGGDSGRAAVVPHDPGQSLLMRAIRRTDPDLAMPPKQALDTVVVADFEQWIREGAPDPRTAAAKEVRETPAEMAARHWAFQPPEKPGVPEVENTAWVQTPIDAFVLERLEAQGLRPAARADRRTLLRRLSFDLWGLPPEPGEVEAFERDESSDAVARQVDRLLASPRYGERWGRHWLDVARYADTKGYVYYYEESRFVHPHGYRDWVIRAFNSDLPYDRFLTLQIAADQVIAAAPGTDAPPGTSAVATMTWPTPVFGPDIAAMGFLTLGRRFLDLAPDIIDDRIDVVMRGVQGLTVSCARCHDHKFDPIPTRDYYSLYGVFEGSEERLVAVEGGDDAGGAPRSAFLSGTRERVQTLERKFREACEQVADRHRERVKDYLVAVLEVARLPSDANVRPQPEDINPYQVRQWDRYLSRAREAKDPVFAPWHTFAALEAGSFKAKAAEVSARLGASSASEVHPAVRAVHQPAPRSMQEVAERYGDLFRTVYDRTKQSRADAATKGVVATTGGAGVGAVESTEADAALRNVLYGADAPVLVPRGSIVDLDVHLYFDDPNRVALAKLQMELEQWVLTNAAAPQHAIVLRDRAVQTEPVVFRRGDPLKRGDAVPRQFLAVVAPGAQRHPFGSGSGRLELARALADPRNPLTARVLVNRVWAQHFGEGLVRTPSDFGVRGDPPSHPELLDWLACWFQERGGSIKALHRLILTSAVFQQAAAPGSAEVREKDPENRLLSHMPRRRLDFEAFRDAMFAVGGELDERLGGPGVDLFKAPFSRRRSVYGYLDRRSVPGVVRAFDVANADMHTPRRHSTTVAQQALVLMNHPLVIERARALARRVERLPDADPLSRVRELYRCALQRGPTAEEVQEARAYLSETEISAAVGGDSDRDRSEEKNLTPWEELAQVILLSNEFAFVD